MTRPLRSRRALPVRSLISCVVLALLALLAGSCNDETSSVFEGERTFWAVDFTTDNSYMVKALPAAEGEYCHVYVEKGRTIDDATARAVAAYFDNVVRPSLTERFGNEPTPDGTIVVDPDNSAKNIFVGDADRDPKVYLLLLDIRDGYTPQAGGAVLGYFWSWNEGEGAYKEPSNEKEILFLDVYPGEVGSNGVLDPRFQRTVAHEFQHMIHWEQKTHITFQILSGLDRADDPWLNEAMSMAAPWYCAGPGREYLAVDNEHMAIFEAFQGDSLVTWGGTSVDYATAYAWAEFLRERCGDGAYYDPTNPARLSSDNVFRRIIGDDAARNFNTGARSVNAAMYSAPDNQFVFQSVFRNWSLASFFGDGSHPVAPATVFLPDNTPMADPSILEYLALDTWRTMPDGVWNLDNTWLALLGLLNEHAPLNRVVLPSLGPWSFAVFRYDNDPSSGSNTGTVKWVPDDPGHTASFVRDDGTVYLEMVGDNVATYGYTNQAWIVLRNNQDVPIGSDNVVPSSVVRAGRSPLSAVAEDPGARLVRERTGKPYGVCVQTWLRERERRLSTSPSR